MSFEDQQPEMIQVCQRIFSEKRAELILGYTTGELEDRMVPAFIHPGQEVERLVWNSACTVNLAKYLLGRKEKVAIVAKPCDSRAIIMYLIEKQIRREQLYLIGMECPGMNNPAGTLAAGCDTCTVKTPPLYDVLIKNGGLEDSTAASPAKPAEQTKLMGDLAGFQTELQKCLLCFSCRQVCYGCYCDTCFMDRNIPNWLPADLTFGSKLVFHLGRAMHLAGRCVECGACQRGCPSGVNLRYLIMELNRFCKELYGYQAGLSPDETPALAVFGRDDREVGFLE
jgi:formate dehydrogenase (coenzyme F420) beta subunit